MELKQGTKFKGNNNNVELQIKEIQGDNAVIIECKTGKTFSYGLGALKRCAITTLEQP